MRSPRRIAIVAAVASLAFVPAVARETDTSGVAPFTVAIVRQDGILTPFATWTGKVYENTWPVPTKEVDTPIAIDGVPGRWWGKQGPTLVWHAWLAGGETTEARATGAAWYPAHCLQGMGLRTSLPLRQPLPPPRVQPYPKVGVAVSRPMDLRGIETVDPAGPLGAVLLHSIEKQVTEDEDRQVKQFLSERWQHPYADDERREVPLRLEALYRTPLDIGGGFIYYFEAMKQYPIRNREGIDRTIGPDTTPPRPKTCEIVTAASGWFSARPDARSVTPRLVRTRLTSCDYESVDVMLPFAYLVLRGRPVWIVQLSGWGRERYVLLDPQSGDETRDVLWSAYGGSCPNRRG